MSDMRYIRGMREMRAAGGSWRGVSVEGVPFLSYFVGLWGADSFRE